MWINFVFQSLTEASLKCVLEHSILDCNDIDDSSDPKCPFFHPVKDVELLHQLAETSASFCLEDPTVSNIFNLCVALWGRLDFYSPESGECYFSFYISNHMNCFVGYIRNFVIIIQFTYSSSGRSAN